MRVYSRCVIANTISTFLRRATVIALCLFTLSVSALEIGESVYRYLEERFGNSAAQRVKQWQNLANFDKAISEENKLKLVNNFFNKIQFVSDIEHWNKEDYWASPIEMLATNGGDCEDFSVAKYFTLRSLGVPEEKMKITYVKALRLNQAHMILAYYPEADSEPLILDNLDTEIKKASDRPDLAPVYSFNGEGLWLSKFGKKPGKRLGSASKLENWQQLLERHSKLID